MGRLEPSLIIFDYNEMLDLHPFILYYLGYRVHLFDGLAGLVTWLAPLDIIDILEPFGLVLLALPLVGPDGFLRF